MRITEVVLGEHGVFCAQFDHLEKSMSAGESLEGLKAKAELLGSALISHAHLEDELLFAPLESRSDTQNGQLAVLKAEHYEIEMSLARLPQLQQLPAVQSLLPHLLSLTRAHFVKEERDLFPMATEILDAEALTQLGARWAERRSVIAAD